jgi:hypothetical protein
MKFNIDLLYGIYEMHKIETTHNGVPTSERVNSGMFTFTRDNRLGVVSGSNESVMAYSASFEVKDDTVFIHVEACNIREREGTTMTRKILKLDGTWLTLEAANADKGRRSEISWKKKISL